MKSLLIRVVLGLAAGVTIYVGMSIWADAGRVVAALDSFAWSGFALAVVLALLNYLLRFVRWQYYLRVLAIDVPVSESLLVFLAGFSLTVTPGKMGEAIKALLLRTSRGVPAARTASIVVAERVTDLLALMLLAAVGMAQLSPNLRRVLGIGAGLVVAGLIVISVKRLSTPLLTATAKIPGLRRWAAKFDEVHRSTAAMLRPAPMLIALGLSLIAWFLECVALLAVVRGFPGATIALFDSTWIYAAMTVAGALSFLPGGLGVSEAVMLALLGSYGSGLDRGSAAAATFLTRGATLWLAVVIGLLALVLFVRQTHVAVAPPDQGR